MGTGIYLYSGMDDNGNLREKYAVILYVGAGDTLGDVKKLHVYDEGFGAMVNDGGQYYSDTTFASGEDMDGNPLSHTNGYTSTGTGIVTLTASDTSAGVGEDAPVASFGVIPGATSNSYPKIADSSAPGAVSFAVGSYDVTFTLKGYLASSDELDSLQIQAVAGGSQVAPTMVTLYHLLTIQEH